MPTLLDEPIKAIKGRDPVCVLPGTSLADCLLAIQKTGTGDSVVVADADGRLRGVLTELAAAFGPITVRWTCRDKQLNARVGGARRSYHLTGNAVDFNMTGNYRTILAFLKAKKEVGGLKHYGGGAFHIDTGPRRTW